MLARRMSNIPEEPRAKVFRRREWDCTWQTPQKDESRAKLEALSARIDKQNSHIAAMMHERNANPADEALKQRLLQAFDDLSAMEREHADALRNCYDDSFPSLSESDAKLMDEARRILRIYENPSSDNVAP